MSQIFRVFVFLLIIALASALSPRVQASRDLEQKVKGLDENTKRRVLSMAAAGVPHDAIAEKIKYVAGKSNTAASRLVHGIKAEAARNAKKSK